MCLETLPTLKLKAVHIAFGFRDPNLFTISKELRGINFEYLLVLFRPPALAGTGSTDRGAFGLCCSPKILAISWRGSNL